jgi:hypothetical protein
VHDFLIAADLKHFLTHGEWVLSILTLAYVVISFFSFRAIKRQAEIAEEAAKAAQKSAEAASSNARALINSERAFLPITVEMKSSSGWFEFTVTNVGRTPAEIISSHSEWMLVASEGDIPPEFEYSTAVFPYPHMVASGEQWSVTEMKMDGEIPGETWEDIRAGKKVAVFYGRVVFRDMVGGGEHCSSFCYCCFVKPSGVRGLKQCGPPSANSYT